MLNKTYVSLEGLGHFRDTILISSINIDNSFIAVPAGTKAKSYCVYYKEVSGSKVKANPQPTEGSTLPGNTYWVLGPGSPDDETRAASVSAVVDYVDDIITNDINPSINSKVSSVWYDTDDKTLGYSNGGDHNVVTFGTNAFTDTAIPTTYAGSSSAGGAATSANKINTDAGSATQPVYFNNGIPVATTYSLEKSVPSNAVFTDTHYTANAVLTSTDSGTSGATSDTTNAATYLNVIENGSKSSGIQITGTGATTVSAKNGKLTINSTNSTNFAGLASGESSGGKAATAAQADVATKLGTSDKGSATQPIYLDDGEPKACTYTIEKSVPSNAVFTDTHYTANAILTAAASDVSQTTTDADDPYLNIIENSTKSSGIQIKGDGATTVSAKNGILTISSTDTTIATQLGTADVGSATKGIYLDDGEPKACTYSVSKDVPSNAVFTDTHYSATPVLAGTTDGTSNVTTSTNDPYLNVIENNAKSGGIRITGSGATTVTANNGVLTISSTDTTVATSLGTSDVGSATKGIYLDDGIPKACTYSVSKDVPANAVFTDTDTHYTANVVLASTAAGTSGASTDTTNTTTFLNVIENSAKSSGIQITGSGATTVSAKNGILTINSTDTTIATKLGTADVGSATKGIYLDDGVAKACTYAVNKDVPSNAVFTDTHYSAVPILTSTTNGTSGATTDTTNTTTFLNVIENSAKSGGIQVTGSGATTVSAKNGILTISSTDTTTATKLGTTDVGSSTKGIYLDDGVPKACTYAVNKDVPSNAVFTDTHYTATPVLASATDGTSNATSDATNPYLNVVENSTKSGGVQIRGDGATTVTAKDGILTISSTDTTVATKLGTSDVGSSTKGIYLDDGVAKACTYAVNKDVPSNAVFTDTHYTANAILASTAAGTSAATTDTTNTTTYLNIIENSAKSSGIQITGSGATKVKAKNGVLTIDSTNTTYTKLSDFADDLGTSPTHTHSQYAPLANPTLTGTPKAPTAAVGTNTTQIATTAYVKAEIDSVLQASDAMRFKGTVGTGGTVATLPNNHSCGDTYKVYVAGSYAGKTCEAGDMLICVKDGTAASDEDWTVVQNNIDGAVTGPGSSTDGNIALFDGTTGKVIKNSSYSPSSFAASSHNHTLSNITDAPDLSAIEALTGTAGFLKKTAANKWTLDNSTYNNYSHPTGDGDLHVPATGTSHNGHILVAGNAAKTFSWKSLADAGITDNKVTQTADDTSASSFEVLFSATADNTNRTEGSRKSSKMTFKPSTGEFSSTKVYNAVWNDLTDRIPVDDECELEYGKVYCFDGEHYYQSHEYCPEGLIGIHSDTSGFEMGHKEGVKELQCSVAGFVLAYVDKEYPVGTALTATCCGYLTEISKKDKIEYPERILATYWKSEPSEEWGTDTNKVKVNGRKWVKIK